MKGFGAVILLLSLISLAVAAVVVATDDGYKKIIGTRKNIVIFLTDDGGFEFPFYGNNVSHTPHLTSLAKRSTIFDRAHTAVSSCSPSRASMLSGVPVHQNG